MRRILLTLGCMLSVICVAHAETPKNPRGSGKVQRVERVQSNSNTVNRSAITRSHVQNIMPRTASVPIQQSRSAVSARSAILPKNNKSVINKSRSANISRSATAAPRATAVFSDTSKLGTGYNACRETYNTCMDQFCAAANDKYRRCFCSDKFLEFSDMETALFSAKTMLQDFSDNNLANVGLSADEVTAMYSATAGEAATITDKSAAAAMLDQIGDLLSGKSKPAPKKTTTLDFSGLNFNAAVDDIWSGSGSGGLFGTSGQDLASLSGTALYNKVNDQCIQVSAQSCENQAIQQMVRSAYGILISQDCQAYSKSIDAQKEQVTQLVRDATKVLRDARLEEYRAHNSASVNECIAAVRKDILNESACGPNFKRCLDFTGVYIDPVKGEPIYSPRLFQLANQIKLENPNAQENKIFLAGLDSFKNRATASLNNCRDDANVVWDAFKRQALIEISQAQDRKLQEVKDECVNTMKDCYDTTTDALNSFDDSSSKRTDALTAKASAAMCKDKVVACAALYTPAGGVACKFDNDNKIINADKCGLRELMNFVNTVDSVKIAEGCEAALESYVMETCAPAVGDTENEFPYGCRIISPEKLTANLQTHAKRFCIGDPEAVIDSETQNSINKIMNQVRSQLEFQMQELCNSSNGTWVSNPADVQGKSKIELDPNFLNSVFGGLNNFKQTVDSSYNLVAAVPSGSNSSSGATDTGRSAVRSRALAPTTTGQYSTSASNTDMAQMTFDQNTSSAPSQTSSQQTTFLSSASDGKYLNVKEVKPDYMAISGNNANNLSSKEIFKLDLAFNPLLQVKPITPVYKSIGWGLCLYNSVAVLCAQQNELTGNQGFAVYNANTNTCELSNAWYKARCESIGSSGYWDSNSRRCYW